MLALAHFKRITTRLRNSGNRISQAMQPTYQQVRAAWHNLSATEQRYLRVLLWFLPSMLLIYIVLFSYQFKHQQATAFKQETLLAQQLAQAAPLLTGTTFSDLPLPELINQIANNSGLTLQQSQIDSTQIAIVTGHPQYGVLANFLTQTQKYGVDIKQFELIQQPDLSLTLSANLHKN